MKRITIKFFIISSIIIAVVLKIESTNAFNPISGTDLYTHARWNSIYDLTEKDTIDILIMGNSRSYNGINPKQLSCATSSLSFIIGAPGTTFKDTYFSFKEILKRTKPKLLVIETYCINNFSYTNSSGTLQSILKSFSAKINFKSKLESTPFLFGVNDWPYAWLTSIRNHNYIFDEKQNLKENIEKTPQIEESIKKGSDNKYVGKYQLYLGKYNGNSGLKKKVIERYKKEGPLTNGATRFVSDTHKEYLKKLNTLCLENNVELMFLTIPVYSESIKNHDVFRNYFGKIIKPLNRNWLDLQNNYDFLPSHFDNVYKAAHHTTADGSFACTKKLVDFIDNKYQDLIPSRKSEKSWLEKFYNTEEYFPYHSAINNDKKVIKLIENKNVDGIIVKECAYTSITQKYGIIWGKTTINDSINKNLKNYNLGLIAKVKMDGEVKNIQIIVPYSDIHSNGKKIVFLTRTKPLEIQQLYRASFIENKKKSPEESI